MDLGAALRYWFGFGCATHVKVAVWRLASVASGLGLVAPIMLVGRRPYRLGRLADRLRAIQDMAVIPDSLPMWLSWLFAAIVATVVGGVVTPVRYRRFHSLVVAVALALAVLVWFAGQSDWTSPTTQLSVVIAFLFVAVAASALPASSTAVESSTLDVHR